MRGRTKLNLDKTKEAIEDVKSALAWMDAFEELELENIYKAQQLKVKYTYTPNIYNF